MQQRKSDQQGDDDDPTNASATARSSSDGMALHLSRMRHQVILARVDMMEAYSPPRVAPVAEAMGMTSGGSLDLTTTNDQGVPWDFSKIDRRETAWDLLGKKKPLVRIVSVTCTFWSSMNNINRQRMRISSAVGRLSSFLSRRPPTCVVD